MPREKAREKASSPTRKRMRAVLDQNATIYHYLATEKNTGCEDQLELLLLATRRVPHTLPGCLSSLCAEGIFLSPRPFPCSEVSFHQNCLNDSWFKYEKVTACPLDCPVLKPAKAFVQSSRRNLIVWGGNSRDQTIPRRPNNTSDDSRVKIILKHSASVSS